MSNDQLEALHEKESAENLIVEKEYMSARDKLLKAQQLFPGLDHIDAMITVCDILSAATDINPSSKVDYYWVLQVGSSSPLSDIKARYGKLVTMIYPIKNKFPGTELALELIQEAFDVLSDKSKRLAVDSHRIKSWADCESLSYKKSMLCLEAGDSTQIAAQPDGIASVKVSGEMHERITTRNIERNAVEDTNRDVLKISSRLNEDRSRTFGTMVQEMLDQDFYDFNYDRQLEKIEPGQIWAVDYRSNKVRNYRYALISANANSAIAVSWLRPVGVSDEERRWCEAGLPISCGSFCQDLEIGEQVCSPVVFSYKCHWVPSAILDQFDIYPKKGEVWALYEGCELNEWSHNPEVIKNCKFKLVELLSDFSKHMGAKSACLEKVDGFRSIFRRKKQGTSSINFHISPSILYRLSHNVPAYKFTGREINGVAEGMLELDLSALPYSTIQDSNNETTMEEKESESSSFTYPERNPSLMITCLGHVVAGEVWAVNCGRDSLPRRYILIHNLISATQVSVKFLETQPIMDYEINWKIENLPVVCGMFRAVGNIVNLETTRLSHRVNCQIGTWFYKIYPLKGEIWAVYEKWNSKWKRSDYENCRYWIVEILSDFSEGEEMMVAKLVQVKGCLTFFERQQFDGFDTIRKISKTEITCFSHRIPSFKVPGIRSYDIPESSWHLEPNALTQSIDNR